MTTMFYTLLLVSIFFISYRADEAVIQAPFDESGSQAPFDDAVTKASFDELENAETKLDAQSDRSTTTLEDRFDKLENHIGILMDRSGETLNVLRNHQNRLVSHLEKVAEKMDTHCKHDPIQKVSKDCKAVYKDCKALYKAGHTTSGVYRINPDSVNEVDVYCEQKMKGGGWTVFQRRINGSVNFYRGWNAYKRGFGSAAGEYWIGNDHLYALTSNQNTQLLVELQYKGKTRYARYKDFSVQDEGNKYRLRVAGYASGSSPGDSLTYHNGLPFSTHDRDNDNWILINCAQYHQGGWWYNGCYRVHPTGPYKGIIWTKWKGLTSLSGIRLMVKTK